MSDELNESEVATEIHKRRSPKSTPATRASHRTYMQEYRRKVNAPEVLVAKRWASALAALSEAERASLSVKAAERREWSNLMTEVCAGVRYGHGHGIAGKTMPYPDALQADIKSWVELNELVEFWCPPSLIGELEAEDWIECDDEHFRSYGCRTRIVRLFWNDFVSHVHAWCMANPDNCDPDVALEVEAHVHARAAELDRNLGIKPTQTFRVSASNTTTEKEEAELRVRRLIGGIRPESV